MRRRHILALSALTPLALASCADAGATGADTGTGTPGTGATQPFSFSPPGYDGLTVSLEKPAVRVVADIYSAAALQPYGIEPVGVWGYGKHGSGKGDLDIDSLNVIGLEGEFSLEKLVAAKPDLIIGFGNTEGTGWTWWDEKVQEQATAVAPFLPVDFSRDTPEDMMTGYRDLAAALGAEVDSSESTKSKQQYDQARERIRTAVADKPELTALAPQFSGDIIYLSRTSSQVRMLIEDGLTFVGPDQAADQAWAEASWETIADWPADVLLVHEASMDGYEKNALYQNLPAVKAGQIGAWDDKRAYTYDAYTSWLTDLAAVLEKAEDIVS